MGQLLLLSTLCEKKVLLTPITAVLVKAIHSKQVTQASGKVQLKELPEQLCIFTESAGLK